MSTSFLPDIAPTRVEGVCSLCEGNGRSYNWTPEYPEPCEICHGAGRATESVWPCEVNLAGGNAILVLRALGLDEEEYGSVDHASIPAVLQRALVVLNRDEVAARSTRAPVDIEGGWGGTEIRHDGNLVTLTRMGPSIIDRGVDLDGLRERIRRVIAVFEWARDAGVGVTWS